MTFPWGVWFEPVQPARRIAELARGAEELGASVCFVADEGVDRDVYVTLTAVLLATERMAVAPAITNPFSRHPVATAAAIATLGELAPGRVWHGLGVGGSRVLGPLGLDPPRPYTALAEAVALNRALLAAETVGPAQIPWARPVPLAIAGRGPRVQALAAATADWVIFSAKPLAHLAAAAAAVRAAGRARIVWSAYLAYDDAARHDVLGHFAYMALDAPPDIRAAAGIDDAGAAQIREHVLAGDLDTAAGLLPPALVEQYAVAGTAAECAAVIATHRAAFDVFMLPMNTVAGAEAHIRRGAEILLAAGAG